MPVQNIRFFHYLIKICKIIEYYRLSLNGVVYKRSCILPQIGQKLHWINVFYLVSHSSRRIVIVIINISGFWVFSIDAFYVLIPYINYAKGCCIFLVLPTSELGFNKLGETCTARNGYDLILLVFVRFLSFHYMGLLKSGHISCVRLFA